ncbi:signal peptidase I [Pedosphaera parvula]|uniref:signal peptidase I n=1 Tax=Pedosphaera parvula TaxID=1032527 RepID=UPI00135F1791|nr:signal peptidase I [Pedosphaera parvula]
MPESRQFLLILCIFLASIGSYFLISRFLIMAVEIKGVSMNPTLIDGDRYLLYRCTYFWRTPRKGEIVVIKDPQDHGLSIKRIVALPEDTVEIRRDGVYVNQYKLSEPYLSPSAVKASGETPVSPTKLGKNSYFVLGDNRSKSFDSRYYGAVQRHEILGYISK